MSSLHRPNNFESGRTPLRSVVTVAAAALIGTVVGGASVFSVVMAVTEPSKHTEPSRHDVYADAGTARNTAPVITAAPQQQAQVNPLPSAVATSSPAVTETPPVQGPRTVWPDALSARDHTDTAPSPTPPAPAPAAAASPASASPIADNTAAANPNDERSARRESDHAPANDTNNAGNMTTASRAVAPKQLPRNSETETKATVSSRNDKNKSRQARQSRPSEPPDQSESADAQPPATYPMRRRVIILPAQAPPPPSASDGRARWSSNRGPLDGLFDVFRPNNNWHDERGGDGRWNNDDRD